MGFEEIVHTADWALRVWADNLEGLFAEAARGMYALSGANQAEGPKVKRTFETQAQDAESLLVAFLSELVYALEQEGVIFDEFDVQVEGTKLKVEMSGAPILSLTKAIKAVTYHNLQVRPTARGYEVEIVFDV
ncbi:MAG: protein archease [Anaerolineae bacterium CG_4_9_14_0_8_um_filter_58_9]|nr:MAG: protein archease [Anaerolineae bacterium CG_4_9_14_0_8_um_filter_58_9]